MANALAPNHIACMTIDWDWSGEPENVATCTCGAVFRVPGRGNGIAGYFDREAKMEALIKAHHDEVTRGHKKTERADNESSRSRNGASLRERS